MEHTIAMHEQMRSKIAELERMNKTQGNTIQDLMDEISLHEKKFEEQSREMAEEKCKKETLEVVLSRVSREDLEKAQRISELTKVIESKEMAISSLRDLHRSDKRSIKSLGKQCGEKDQRILELEDIRKSQERTILDLKEASRRRSATIQNLREELYNAECAEEKSKDYKMELAQRVLDLEKAGQEMAANYQAMADKLNSCREELRKKTYDLEYFQELFNEEHEKLKIIADQRDQGMCDLDQMREAYQTVAEQLKECRESYEYVVRRNTELVNALARKRPRVVDCSQENSQEAYFLKI